MSKNQRVTTHPNGGWQVKGAGNSKATVKTSTQASAISIAREIAINQQSEVVIQQIRSKNSYGDDPFPPKG